MRTCFNSRSADCVADQRLWFSRSQAFWMGTAFAFGFPTYMLLKAKTRHLLITIPYNTSVPFIGASFSAWPSLFIFICRWFITYRPIFSPKHLLVKKCKFMSQIYPFKWLWFRLTMLWPPLTAPVQAPPSGRSPTDWLPWQPLEMPNARATELGNRKWDDYWTRPH